MNIQINQHEAQSQLQSQTGRVQSEILRPAEWVFPGHPDKLADAVAEHLVLEAAKREAFAEAVAAVAVSLLALAQA